MVAGSAGPSMVDGLFAAGPSARRESSRGTSRERSGSNAMGAASRREPASSPASTQPGPAGSSPTGLQLPSAPRRAPARVHPAQVHGTSSGRPARGATTLFEVPFACAMSELELALLERALDLSIRMHAKMHPRPDSPGLVRLDHYSGLFLERGAAEGQWMLQARTWGHPAPQSVHGWHVVAAGAAHQLDPTVTLPERPLRHRARDPGPSTRTSCQQAPCPDPPSRGGAFVARQRDAETALGQTPVACSCSSASTSAQPMRSTSWSA
jgi:hypothetical protein